MADGFFMDWDGNLRSTAEPGGTFRCEVDPIARYVAVYDPAGTLVHEATMYRNLEAVAKAGIKAELVPGSVAWGAQDLR